MTTQAKEELLTTINNIADYLREVTIKANLFIIYYINVQLEYVYNKTYDIISNILKAEKGIKAFLFSLNFYYAFTQLITSDQSKPTTMNSKTNTKKKYLRMKWSMHLISTKEISIT